jgi:hypothetical protein
MHPAELLTAATKYTPLESDVTDDHARDEGAVVMVNVSPNEEDT